VNSAEELAKISGKIRDDPESGIREGWSYLDTRDAARSIELSLTARTTGAHAFFLAANNSNSPYRTEDLLRRYAPDVPRLRRFVEREVPIDLTPARKLIGFQAAHELDIPTLDLP
ncbi:MAG: hypothetical protein QOI70_1946, partial [Microbacteriaceae bacterium]|nr:hypothetical protein [Microbacteriaceae bacterium]